MKLTVQEHNFLKTLSVLFIAISGINLAADFPYHDYVALIFFVLGPLGYGIANALVDPSTITTSVESIAVAVAGAATMAKNLPASTPAKSVLQQLMDNPSKTVAEAQDIFDQATKNYKALVAAQTETTSTTATTSTTSLPT